MSDDKALAKLAPWRQKYRRSAWRPITKPGDAGPDASKFSGIPWLADDETWPTCDVCGAQLQLLLQLDLDRLPAELASEFGEGLLQVFCCRGDGECNSADEACEEFGTSSKVLRIVRDQRDGSAVETPDNPGFLLARTIVGWEQFDDYPSSSDHDLLGLQTKFQFRALPNREGGDHVVAIDGRVARFDPPPMRSHDPNLSDEENAAAAAEDVMAFMEAITKISEEAEEVGPVNSIEATIDLNCPVLGLQFTGLSSDFSAKLSDAIKGDKLFGWPCWEQDSEYSTCAKCGKAMRLLFQLGSNDNLAFMFGDVGTAYLTQCATHHDMLAFMFQCS